MSRSGDVPANVEALYRQLACERVGRAQGALIQEPVVERLLAQSAAALEDAAAVLLHTATAFTAMDRPLPGLAEQAGVLLAFAARFEEAADLRRSARSGEGEEGSGDGR